MTQTKVIFDGPGYLDITYDPHVDTFVLQARAPDEDALATVTMTKWEALELVRYIETKGTTT